MTTAIRTMPAARRGDASPLHTPCISPAAGEMHGRGAGRAEALPASGPPHPEPVRTCPPPTPLSVLRPGDRVEYQSQTMPAACHGIIRSIDPSGAIDVGSRTLPPDSYVRLLAHAAVRFDDAPPAPPPTPPPAAAAPGSRICRDCGGSMAGLRFNALFCAACAKRRARAQQDAWRRRAGLRPPRKAAPDAPGAKTVTPQSAPPSSAPTCRQCGADLTGSKPRTMYCAACVKVRHAACKARYCRTARGRRTAREASRRHSGFYGRHPELRKGAPALCGKRARPALPPAPKSPPAALSRPSTQSIPAIDPIMLAQVGEALDRLERQLAWLRLLVQGRAG